MTLRELIYSRAQLSPQEVSLLPFDRMPLEIWFDNYQFEVDYDIGESGTKFDCKTV
jgi:hypothetical protein